MSLSQRDTKLLFRKRRITGKNVLTSLEDGASLLQGPDKKVARAKVVATTAKGKALPSKKSARFRVEKKSGLLRTGN